MADEVDKLKNALGQSVTLSDELGQEQYFDLLNSDAEFIDFTKKFHKEYKINIEDLMKLVIKAINSAGFHSWLNNSSLQIPYDKSGELDGDLMGMLGIKMSAEIISKLEIDDDGFAFLDEDEIDPHNA